MQGTLAHLGNFNYADLSATLQSARLSARLLGRVIFYALLALLAFAAIPYGAAEPWWDALVQCGVLVLATLWMIEGWLSRTWRVSGGKLLLPLAVLAVFAFAQSLAWWSADPYETRLVAFKIVALTLALALLMRYTSSRRRLRALIRVVIGVGAVSAVFGIARYVLLDRWLDTALPRLSQSESFGQFIDRNHFAFLMEMSFGLAMGLILGGGVLRQRIPLYATAAAVIGAALLMLNSRGALLSLISQLLFLLIMLSAARPAPEAAESRYGLLTRLWDSRHSLILRGTLSICLLVVLVAGVVWMASTPFSRLSETLPVPGSAGAKAADAVDNAPVRARRLEMWRATWLLIEAHPFFGTGFGAYHVAVTQHNRTAGKFSLEHAHNDYLELFAAGGLFAAALGGWFLLVFLVKVREHLDRSAEPARRAACYGALAGLFAIAVHSFLDFGLHVTANALVAVALIVIATVSIRSRLGDKEPDAPA